MEGKHETVFFFTDDKIAYIENSKESMKELLELISKYSETAGYMVNKS